MDKDEVAQRFNSNLITVYNQKGVEIIIPKSLVNLWIAQNPLEATEPGIDAIVQESVAMAL